MKKLLSILLILCLLVPLGAQAFAAKIYTAEEFEALKQSAEGGNADAMAELGGVYYLGNYKSGISRDFGRAQDWFERAAEAGNTEVLTRLATIYERGSAGERNIDKAYSCFKQAAALGDAKAQEALNAPLYDTFRWKDNASLLTGRLGEDVLLYGKSGMPFYLDNPVENCGLITMELHILEHSGWPYGLYGLYYLDFNGEWRQINTFSIERDQEDGSTRTYEFAIAEPISFKGLAVGLVEDGMEFNLIHEDKFYVDKNSISAYSAAIPEPVFNPVNEQYTRTSASVYTTAYVNPYPAG